VAPFNHHGNPSVQRQAMHIFYVSQPFLGSTVKRSVPTNPMHYAMHASHPSVPSNALKTMHYVMHPSHPSVPSSNAMHPSCPVQSSHSMPSTMPDCQYSSKK
jgi:hypothetical protein